MFALIISILLLFSVNATFAGDNETISDVVSAPIELDKLTQDKTIQELIGSQSDEGKLTAGSNVINVHIMDSYNETSNTWDEDGVNLAGATVKLNVADVSYLFQLAWAYPPVSTNSA